MKAEDGYWISQLEEYTSIQAPVPLKYKTWQPARFAGNQSCIVTMKRHMNPIPNSCIELGAGSAAFLLALYEKLNIRSITAVDYSSVAQTYGTLIFSDMGIPLNYILGDFFSINQSLPICELVVSLGVIEHFNILKRKAFIRLCDQLSNRYIFIAIPNQESPLFLNYVNYMKKRNMAYEKKHERLTINMLVDEVSELGMNIVHIDGFQCFLSDNAYWNELPAAERPFVELLCNGLKQFGYPCATPSPETKFSYRDIETLTKIETTIAQDLRKKYSFMNYVLIQKGGN